MLSPLRLSAPRRAAVCSALVAGAAFVGAFVVGAAGFTAPAAACSPEVYLGTLCAFPMQFCPKGWIEADGRSLPIQGNEALYSLYGTVFGGDGKTSFAVPDLRGRAVIGIGVGGGTMAAITLGQKVGQQEVTLQPTQTGVPPVSVTSPINAVAKVAIPATTAAAVTATPGPSLVFASPATGGQQPSDTPVNAYAPAESTTTLKPFTAPVTGSVSVTIPYHPPQHPVSTQSPAIGIRVCLKMWGDGAYYPERP